MPGSINHNAYASALPNFRNLGVLLRILVIVTIMAVAAAALKSDSLSAVWREVLEVSAVVQPALMLSLIILVMLNGVLKRAPYIVGAAFVVVLELMLVTVVYW